ncbi:hypothetical protein BLNAU_4847 [Blattamonas nauphoetae]|uniref:UBR-type domain-containing protein n=1 Tax=Blattamonas nauphoetae TaxID=2049346 RepID=A0ABQ9Y9B4_9EUKA|nr:hypothetical protein BLNAU_4847 [Blattamonas nauphoetae]
MFPDLSGTHEIDSSNGIKPPENTMQFFTECLTRFKNSDEKTKMEVVHSVQSQVLSDERRVGELCSSVVCVTGLVGVVVSGASLPVRGRVSSLLPSLLGLISGDESWKTRALSMVGGLASLCAGLGEFIQREKEKKTKKSGGQEGIFEDAESEFSLLSRSSSALSLIETTLGEMLTELQRQKQSTEMDQERKALRDEVARVLKEHFTESVTPRTGKPGGVIGLDIGMERQKMEEQLRMKMKELEEERQREKEEMAQAMLELKKEQEKNAQLIEQGRKWAEQERKRKEEEDHIIRQHLLTKSCTFFKNDQTTYVTQPYYDCRTCNMLNPKAICATCITSCHSGHDVAYVRDGIAYCDCCIECDCKQLPDRCLTKVAPNTSQGFFRCKTCNQSDLCLPCARKCHSGHDIALVNRGSFICACSKGDDSSMRCRFSQEQTE